MLKTAQPFTNLARGAKLSGFYRQQHGAQYQEREFIAAHGAVLGEFMDRIDSVADTVDKQHLQSGSDTDCAQKLRIAVQDLRQVPLLPGSIDRLLGHLLSVCFHGLPWLQACLPALAAQLHAVLQRL